MLLIAGSIPVILAILIVIPMITKSEIPQVALLPDDIITIEYTKHQLKTVSFGVAERAGAQKTEILKIKNDGEVTYTVTNEGYPQPDKESKIDKEKLKKITAMIKETGVMEIPNESFPIREDVSDYQKSTIKVTLNGVTSQIHWPEQNATEKFVPPIITIIESELDLIIDQIIE